MPRAYVVFHAPVTGTTAQHLITTSAQLVQQGFDELYMLLSTPGGNVSSGLTIYNMLRGLPAKIITHNAGNIDSIGNTVFLAGEERFACPHSTFMFHGVGMDVANMRIEEKNAKEAVHSILQDQKRIGAIIADRTQINAAKARKLFREARTKDAEAALAAGIIHGISDINIPTGAPVVSLVLDA